MKSLILIIITTAFINNVVLNQFLGICSFLGVSKQMKASASLGGAVIFVITIASAVASLLYDYVLAPLGMDFMKTIVFILVIAALVQIVEMFLKKSSPSVYKALGIYLPLITTNCAVLGVALTNVQNGYNFLESVLAGFGTGVGYSVLDVVHAFEEANGVRIPYEICARRPGDIAVCYASTKKAEEVLGFKAKYGIDEMCSSCWKWQTMNPEGLKD